MRSSCESAFLSVKDSSWASKLTLILIDWFFDLFDERKTGNTKHPNHDAFNSSLLRSQCISSTIVTNLLPLTSSILTVSIAEAVGWMETWVYHSLFPKGECIENICPFLMKYPSVDSHVVSVELNLFVQYIIWPHTCLYTTSSVAYQNNIFASLALNTWNQFNAWRALTSMIPDGGFQIECTRKGFWCCFALFLI